MENILSSTLIQHLTEENISPVQQMSVSLNHVNIEKSPSKDILLVKERYSDVEVVSSKNKNSPVSGYISDNSEYESAGSTKCSSTCSINEIGNQEGTNPKIPSPTLLGNAIKAVKNLFSPEKNKSKTFSTSTPVGHHDVKNSGTVDEPEPADFKQLNGIISKSESDSPISSRDKNSTILLDDSSPIVVLDSEKNTLKLNESGISGIPTAVLDSSFNVSALEAKFGSMSLETQNGTDDSFKTTFSRIDDSFQSTFTHLDNNADDVNDVSMEDTFTETDFDSNGNSEVKGNFLEVTTLVRESVKDDGVDGNVRLERTAIELDCSGIQEENKTILDVTVKPKESGNGHCESDVGYATFDGNDVTSSGDDLTENKVAKESEDVRKRENDDAVKDTSHESEAEGSKCYERVKEVPEVSQKSEEREPESQKEPEVSMSCENEGQEFLENVQSFVISGMTSEDFLKEFCGEREPEPQKGREVSLSYESELQGFLENAQSYEISGITREDEMKAEVVKNYENELKSEASRSCENEKMPENSKSYENENKPEDLDIAEAPKSYESEKKSESSENFENEKKPEDSKIYENAEIPEEALKSYEIEKKPTESYESEQKLDDSKSYENQTISIEKDTPKDSENSETEKKPEDTKSYETEKKLEDLKSYESESQSKDPNSPENVQSYENGRKSLGEELKDCENENKSENTKSYESESQLTEKHSPTDAQNVKNASPETAQDFQSYVNEIKSIEEELCKDIKNLEERISTGSQRYSETNSVLSDEVSSYENSSVGYQRFSEPGYESCENLTSPEKEIVDALMSYEEETEKLLQVRTESGIESGIVTSYENQLVESPDVHEEDERDLEGYENYQSFEKEVEIAELSVIPEENSGDLSKSYESSASRNTEPEGLGVTVISVKKLNQSLPETEGNNVTFEKSLNRTFELCLSGNKSAISGSNATPNRKSSASAFVDTPKSSRTDVTEIPVSHSKVEMIPDNVKEQPEVTFVQQAEIVLGNKAEDKSFTECESYKLMNDIFEIPVHVISKTVTATPKKSEMTPIKDDQWLQTNGAIDDDFINNFDCMKLDESMKTDDKSSSPTKSDCDLSLLIQEKFTANDVDKICSVVDLNKQILRASELFDKSMHEKLFDNEVKSNGFDHSAPDFFDFLETFGQTTGGRDFSRESLYVKFDPLVEPKAPLIDISKEELKAPEVLVKPQRQTSVVAPLCAEKKDKEGNEKNTRELEAKLRKLRRELAERENSNKEMFEDFESRIAKLTGQVCLMADKLKESETREKATVRKFNEQKQNLNNLKSIMDEYQKVIARLTDELDDVRKTNRDRIEKLKTERDSYMIHLQNTEAAFTDVHAKYEKSKKTIEFYKKNDRMYREVVSEQNRIIEEYKIRETEVKDRTERELNRIKGEMDDMKHDHVQETSRIRAQLRKTELQVQTIQETLDQKIKENKELATICDELIAGNKSN